MSREPKLEQQMFVPSLGMVDDSLFERIARKFRMRLS